jgi:hypothetical protein
MYTILHLVQPNLARLERLGPDQDFLNSTVHGNGGSAFAVNARFAPLFSASLFLALCAAAQCYKTSASFLAVGLRHRQCLRPVEAWQWQRPSSVLTDHCRPRHMCWGGCSRGPGLTGLLGVVEGQFRRGGTACACRCRRPGLNGQHPRH